MKSLKVLTMAGAMALATAATAEDNFITIGTAGQTGVYYVVGQSICRLVNRASDENNLKCTAPSTGASVANINAIKAGDMGMGLAQSDTQFDAYNGTGRFDGEKYEKLRSVFSIHGEPFTVVARADSGIKSFEDLKGERVNVGNPGAGSLATMEVVMEALGWTMDDFALASQLKAAEQSAALGDNKVDAIIYTVGHPNGSIQEATSVTDARIIAVEGPVIDELIADNSYYAKATIPGGMYTENPDDITTFGVKATLVSSTEVPGEVVYAVVKAVFDNFDRFKALHPAFANLKEESMIQDGLSAPLHPGAVKYYKERGWM